MTNTKIIAVLLAVLFAPFLYSLEQEIFSPKDFAAVLRGNTKPVGVLDGDLLAITVPGGGKNAILSRTNTSTKKTEQIVLPVPIFNYLAVSKTSPQMVLYCYNLGEIWHIDLNTKRSTLIHKREKGNSGFDFYRHGRSRLEFIGDKAYGWGYEYNNKMELLHDCVFEMKIPREGKMPEGTALKRVLKYDDLIDIARRHDPQAKHLGRLLFNGKYLLFSTVRNAIQRRQTIPKEGEKKPKKAKIDRSGKLIAVRVQTKTSFVIFEFTNLLGAALQPQGSAVAYTSVSGKEAKLHIYNLQSRKEQHALEGNFIQLQFSGEGDKLGAIDTRLVEGKLRQQFFVLKLTNFSHKRLPLNKKKLYMNWQFAEKGKSVLLFLGQQAIYRYPLKK